MINLVLRMLLISIVATFVIKFFILPNGNFQEDESHYSDIVVYDNSVCKNKEFIANRPIRVYRFFDDNSFQSKLLPYYSEFLDEHKISKKTNLDYDYTVKLYPPFVKYKIGKIYGHCSFDAGCSDDFKIEAEDGFIFWLSSADINISTCQPLSSYNYKHVEIANEQRINKRYASLKQDKIEQKVPVFSYESWKDLKFIKKIATKYKFKNGKKVSLKISIGDKYNELYYFNYTRRILEKFFPKKFKGTLSVKLIKRHQPPIFQIGSRILHPYICREGSKDPFACFKKLDKWIKGEYEPKGFAPLFKKIAKYTDKKYILINFRLDEIDFEKYHLLSGQIKVIKKIIGEDALIVVDFNSKLQEGIYVKSNTKIYQRFHVMAQEKFLKPALSQFEYARLLGNGFIKGVDH